MKNKSLKQQSKIMIIFIILLPLSIMFMYLLSRLNSNEGDKVVEEFKIIKNIIHSSVSKEMKYSVGNVDLLVPYFSNIGQLNNSSYKTLLNKLQLDGDDFENIVFMENGVLYKNDKISIDASTLEKLKLAVYKNYNIDQKSFVSEGYMVYWTKVEDDSGVQKILINFSKITDLVNLFKERFSEFDIKMRLYVDEEVVYDSFVFEVTHKMSIGTDETEVYKINREYLIAEDIVEGFGVRYELFYEFKALESFVVDNKYVLMFLLMYICAAILAMGYFINNLVKPIDDLNEALEQGLDMAENSMELSPTSTKEFNELYQSFFDLKASINSNYEDIEKQLTKIEDKNDMMLDLNTQLESSMALIEKSSGQLDYARKKNKALIDNITYMMWRIDKDRRITYINEEVKKKLGFEVEELMGKSLNSIMCPVHEYSNCSDIVEEFFREDFIEVDLWFLQSDFEQREIYSTSTKRIYEDGELVCVQGISKLVTEARYLQKEVASKTRELETLNDISKLLTDFEELATLLDLITDSIDNLINPYYSAIALIEDDKLVLAASSIKDNVARNKDISGEISENLALAIHEKKIILLSGHEASKENIAFIEEPFEDIQDVMYIPMESNNEVIGVLTLVNKVELSEFKINVIKLFIQQASVAIDRAKIYSQLRKQYLNTIEALATAVEAKDVYTLGHSRRVSMLSKLLASEMGCDKDFVSNIEQSGLLHDIGKISISDEILTKDGKLTDFEYDEIKKHPELGEKILRPIGLANDIIDGVLLHHVRYDLKGYPGNININELPLSARIIGVADAFDAITSKRSYHSEQDIEVAIEEIIRCKGTQFCPLVVNQIELLVKHNKSKIEEIIYS